MASRPPEMTPAEFKLMKVLWALKKGTVAHARAEHNRMYGSDLAYTTVMTLLGRLAAKRAVKVDKSRQPYLYRPAFRRESVLRDRLRHFVETVFDGKADSLVLHLLEDESLSLEELRDIERKIEGQEEDDES
ncbi:MAG: BlaI/MecI/CopY family transcriptional regulator [Proteobacteria bacterium]|nr:BlaI/MecI/CopY family transcriptional regulator [Pseudomonadota bacterium]